ncbi:MAG: hypothetical protein PHG03_02155 [Bacilli bacterium]|nr:hypothetical protein [Bacilli bacterium]MDD4795342.1 hypothetical protein [Bacilli bacterium]
MLKDLLNKEVSLTYVMGYSYGIKKGVITKVSDDYIVINNTFINTKMIVKVVVKERR